MKTDMPVYNLFLVHVLTLLNKLHNYYESLDFEGAGNLHDYKLDC